MEYLALCLLGGALALESTSVGQFMLARPVVAGVLTGSLLGAPGTGLIVGTLLEVFTLPAFPTGGARLPEGGPATVVGVFMAAQGNEPGALVLGVAFGLVWSSVGGRSVVRLRRLNGKLAPDDSVPDAVRAIARAHWTSLALDACRGAVLTAAGLLAGSVLISRLAPQWPLPLSATLGVLGLAASVSAGALLSSLGGLRRRVGFILAGLAVGGVGVWLL